MMTRHPACPVAVSRPVSPLARLAAGLLWLVVTAVCAGAGPLKIHPENSRYFLIDGRAAVLVGSSEHYGALIHTGFDFIRYLDEVKGCGLNYVRIFSGVYREVPGSFGIEANTLAPPLGSEILPWARSGVAGAMDGGAKFDLGRWNETYFQRLRDFAREAAERGIFVELTLFCTFYDDATWRVCPLNPRNHIHGGESLSKDAAHRSDGPLLVYQKALARKCALELRDHGNVFLEIINEPYVGKVPDEWERLIVDEIVSATADRTPPLLIARNVANREGRVERPHPAVSIYQFHYAKPAAALENRGLARVIGNDETGSFFLPKGEGGLDRHYRREAWAFLLAGGAVMNHLDYSFTVGREDGTAVQLAPGGGGRALRKQLGFLRATLDSLPLEKSAALAGVIEAAPAGAVVFGAADSHLLVWLPDAPAGSIKLHLAAGRWNGQWLDPVECRILSEVVAVHADGAGVSLSVPQAGERVLVLRRAGDERR